MLKESSEDSPAPIFEIMIKLRNAGAIQEEKEGLKAIGVLIYEEGDTNKFKTYRPISLFNTL